MGPCASPPTLALSTICVETVWATIWDVLSSPLPFPREALWESPLLPAWWLPLPLPLSLLLPRESLPLPPEAALSSKTRHSWTIRHSRRQVKSEKCPTCRIDPVRRKKKKQKQM